MSSNGVATPVTAPAMTEFSGAAAEQMYKAVVATAFTDAIRPIIPHAHSVARDKKMAALFKQREHAITVENNETRDARRWLAKRGEDFTYVVSLAGFDADHMSEQAAKCEARGWKAMTRELEDA